MRNLIAGVALVALTSLGLALASPGTAAADPREFVGKVIKIDEKKIVVKNRMKDKMDFIQSDATVVEGNRSRWNDIKQKDRVTVTWDVADKPRRAHQIKVMPPEKK